jgi:hypothetical protein
VSLSASGQWYTKTYGVNDINSLSLDQLQESLKKSNKSIWVSVIVVGIGGVAFLLEKVQPSEVNEDSPLIQQIIGSKGMHYVTMGMGACMALFGVIGCLVHIDRSSIIRRTIKRNFPVQGQLNITPALLFNSYTGGYTPGISLAVRF